MIAQRLAFLCGGAGLVLIWALAAGRTLPVLLPGPGQVMGALWGLLAERGFWLELLLPSLGRAAAGLGIAFVIGATLGLAGGRWPVVAALTAPLRLILQGMPAPVLAILCILWFDGGTTTVILTVAALLVPVFQIALAEGMSAADPQMTEMARLFRVPLLRRLRHILLPAWWGALGPALRTALANALRVTLLTELLAGAEGIGAAVQRAQSWLQTDRLFALVIVILAVIGLAEAALGALTKERRRP